MRARNAIYAYLTMGLFTYAFAAWINAHGAFAWSSDKTGLGSMPRFVPVDLDALVAFVAAGAVALVAIAIVSNGMFRWLGSRSRRAQ
jgi:hypothetical protein